MGSELNNLIISNYPVTCMDEFMICYFKFENHNHLFESLSYNMRTLGKRCLVKLKVGKFYLSRVNFVLVGHKFFDSCYPKIG